MKTQMLLLTMTLTTVLAACAKSPKATSAADNSVSAASNSLVVTPITNTPTAGQTITLTVSGGSGVYISMTATQGSTPVQTSATQWSYVVPTSFTLPQVNFTATDSAGATGQAFVAIQGTSTGTTPGQSQSLSCAGMYNGTFNTLTGKLFVVQNTSNQIGGYIYFDTSKYYQPISGTCNFASGQTNGTITFKDLEMNTQYNATVTNSGGQLVLNGNVDGRIAFQATSASVSAAPTAETVACSGVYNGTFAGNQGQLTLVHNGSGTMAGSLVIVGGGKTNKYAVTGTCGASITMTNVTTGSTYTGSFNGSMMSGTYTLAAGSPNPGPYSFSVSK